MSICSCDGSVLSSLSLVLHLLFMRANQPVAPMLAQHDLLIDQVAAQAGNIVEYLFEHGVDFVFSVDAAPFKAPRQLFQDNPTMSLLPWNTFQATVLKKKLHDLVARLRFSQQAQVIVGKQGFADLLDAFGVQRVVAIRVLA